MNWRSFRWWPSSPPDHAEYEVLRGLDEDGMKRYLKVLQSRVRQELSLTSPYSYKRAFHGIVFGTVMLAVAGYFNLEERSSPLLYWILHYGGWLVIIRAVFFGASASMTYDSIRKNLIVSREHYIRCWVAAQKMDFDQFTRHITQLIDRGPPEYDVL